MNSLGLVAIAVVYVLLARAVVRYGMGRHVMRRGMREAGRTVMAASIVRRLFH
jgi:hypothetical protein